jgi:hypothetical protein
MTSELRDSAEARTIRPSGFESPRLVINNEDMAAFSGQSRQDSRAADREQDMYGAGFSFSQAGLADLYGASGCTGERLSAGFQKLELYDSKMESPVDVVAWDPKEQVRSWEKDIKKTAGEVKQAGGKVSAELTKEGAILDKPAHPYKDNPDQQMDYNACHKAWNSFPALQRHANLDPAILPAIVRNEVSHLRVDDQLIWNPAAAHGYDYNQRPETTIGPANMMVSNIRHLVQKYPQLTDPEKGGIDPKHILEDAIKPRQAAWLAAAYLADKTEAMEAHGRKVITHHDLIKSYNPEADQKQQFKLIHQQLIEIKQHHPLFRSEQK